jgi:cell division protein DivIC
MKKYRKRMLIYCCALLGMLAILGFSCYQSWNQIVQNKKEVKLLQEQYEQLLTNESDLESNLAKLKDPEYVAQYAREKYFYSRDGEIIIDMVDKDENKSK